MFRRFLTLITLLLSCHLIYAQGLDTDKIGPNLWNAFQIDSEQQFSFYVLMEDKYDIHRLYDQLKSSNKTLKQGAKTVNQSLQAFAEIDQKEIRSFFRDYPSNDLAYYKPHWIINTIYVEATWSVIKDLSLREDVSMIQFAGALVADKTEDFGQAAVEVMNTESTLFKINAHKMWELGYTGYGVTCLTADTGVDPYHPSIVSQQRASVVDQFGHAFYHDQNTEYSFDCGDHGTHVTGTILGLDRLEDDTIGVAFNGQWMGAAVLCGIGTADNVDAFEWAMDPDNDPNTVDDMPAFINNSWHDPSIDDACVNIYVDMLTAVEAAGIGVVFSAGNAGSGSSTITNPKNLNMGLVNTFSVGALNNSGTDITDFSSRGPSICFSQDSSINIKPEVSAPGQTVRSCVPGGQYGFKSGTSMAAPHVAGALMLLKEAFPFLSGEDLKLALYYTAVDLGAEGEDNTYGMGIIDVFAAYEYLLDQGYVAADPSVNTDIFVFGLQSEKELCQSNIPCSFGIENGGSEPVQGIQVNIALGSEQFSILLDTLTLEPGERHYIAFDSISNEIGTHYLSVEIAQIDAAEDDRPLNNRVVTRVENKPYYPSVFEVNNDAVCIGGVASITGLVGNDMEGYFKWYSDENLINLIGEGLVLNLPIEEEETSIYAKTLVQETAGPKVQQAYLNYPNQPGKGLMIKAKDDIYFESFFVNVEVTGTVFFRIYDGTEIVKTIVSNLALGPQKVFVGLDLEEDKEYEIQFFNGFAKLLSHDYSLPFSESGDIVDILYSIDQGGFEFDKYFFFYDMKFDFPVECAVQKIDISASNESSISVLSFNLDQSQFNNVIEFATVNPIANIEGDYISLIWDFGDGNTSSELEPSHTYSDAGDYLISLIATDAEGCESVYSSIVRVDSYLTKVNEVQENDFIIYPNPFIGSVNISCGNREILKIKVLDTSGKSLFAQEGIMDCNYQLDLTDIPPGVLFVQIWDGRFWLTKKLIKQ